MTLIYSDPKFLEHETGSHPERPRRLLQTVAHLEQKNLFSQCRQVEWQPAAESTLELVHDSDYLRFIRELAERGGGHADADTVLSTASYEVAKFAAGAVCDGVDRVVRGEERHALCLVRPPGHHALRDTAMGFCLLANVSIAARYATDVLGLDRVMIVDWDVHHGNGTQAIFYDDPRVGFFSAHRFPFYPGTGDADETGTGDGLGTTCNLPMKFGISRDRYLSEFARALQDFADKMRPQLVIVSAGFDAHAEDPVGNLGLENEDFQSLTAAVLDVAAAHANGRVVSTLEGGYKPQRLAECVQIHLEEFLERDRDLGR